LAYAKYLGFLSAQAEMHRMISDGSWTLGKVNSDTLIEVFVSKSVWHAHYSKLFPHVKRFPNLLKWLENGDDAPSSVDIFGVVKAGYSFKDLRVILAHYDAFSSKKEKKKRHRETEDDGGVHKRSKKNRHSLDGQGSSM
jgi:hypothetical protein